MLEIHGSKQIQTMEDSVDGGCFNIEAVKKKSLDYE